MALPINGGQRYCNTMGSIIRASSEVKVPFSPSALKSVLLQSRKTEYFFMNSKCPTTGIVYLERVKGVIKNSEISLFV